MRYLLPQTGRCQTGHPHCLVRAALQTDCKCAGFGYHPRNRMARLPRTPPLGRLLFLERWLQASRAVHLLPDRCPGVQDGHLDLAYQEGSEHCPVRCRVEKPADTWLRWLCLVKAPRTPIVSAALRCTTHSLRGALWSSNIMATTDMPNCMPLRERLATSVRPQARLLAGRAAIAKVNAIAPHKTAGIER